MEHPADSIAVPSNDPRKIFYWITPCTCRRGLFWKGTDHTDLVVLQRGKYTVKDGKTIMIDNPHDTVMGACTRFGCLGRWRSNLARLKKLPDMSIDSWKSLKAPWLPAGAMDHLVLLGSPPNGHRKSPPIRRALLT